MGELSTLFAPGRVAVIGASEKEGTVGYAVTQNLRTEFDGDVLAVNPNRDTVLGLTCYESIAAVDDVDVAVVAVPPGIAVDVVRETAQAGIENVVVITAGFSEAGSDGATREQKLVAIAEEYDLNLVGPNSLGIMSTGVGLNATFGPESPAPGDISFMSQSGAFITAVLDWADDRAIGFRDIVSLGNKAVLDEADFVREWGDDPETDVILGYLEDIGDGQEFIRTAREVTQSTPIVVVKSGRTDEGASAAASHTGAIAGSDRAYEAGLAQAGVLRVSTVQELFDFASILAGQPLPKQDGVAIVTNAGGPGVMTTDAVGEADLELADFTDDTLDRLGEALPAEANIYNPVDIIGDAPVERFEDALDIVLDDENVGMGVVLTCPTATLEFEDLAEASVRLQAEYGTPMAATMMGGSSIGAAETVFNEAGIPTYFDPDRAIRSLEALWTYANRQDREYVEPQQFDIDHERIQDILADALDEGRTRLGVESMSLLDACGIPTPDGTVVDSPRAAREIAADIGGDVVMKIVSPEISHKSDIGGVEVGVPTEAVLDTYEDLVVRARNYQPDATILGVQVQEMVDLDSGTETIVGVTRDPQFGPLVMFGLGGIFVEIMEDTSFRVAPVPESEVREMVDEIQSAPLLYGARGREPTDVDELVSVIQRISQLVTSYPAITELDLNPVVATQDGVSAVDLRLTLDPERFAENGDRLRAPRDQEEL
jgi:acetyl coenzyme A synthetase (ADP forming)-like protein